jgi:hypothetical protein
MMPFGHKDHPLCEDEIATGGEDWYRPQRSGDAEGEQEVWQRVTGDARCIQSPSHQKARQ